MRRYLQHLRDTKTPHQRRLHAMQISGVLTAALFAVWVGTLGVRLTAQDTLLPSSAGTSLSAAAATARAVSGPHLEVSTTSAYQQ